MSGHRRTLSGRRLIALLAATCFAALGSLLIAVGPAGAATTVKAQLSLTGITTSDNPTGGSTLGIHPGDTVSISSSLLPLQGLEKLGLADLVTGLVNNLASYQVDADFTGLPGGKKDTVLKGAAAQTFTFPKAGTYSFTWSAQTIALLGGVVPLNLDGNQLAAAGVKLNAQNQYVGKIVVATNPPQGGIALQLPGVSVQPTLPIVGTLPKVTLPGITTPTIPVNVPNLNPTKPTTGATTPAGGKSTITTPTGPVIPVPALVVPQGTDKIYSGSGGYTADSISSSTGSLSGNTTSGTTVTKAKAAPAGKTATANSTGKDKTINLAADRPSSAAGLPVVLAIVAMVALVLVAGTYARLFLLRKS